MLLSENRNEKSSILFLSYTEHTLCATTNLHEREWRVHPEFANTRIRACLTVFLFLCA